MKLKTIYFATTNEGKLKEARSILGINIKSISLQLDEVQSPDPEYVATKKALDYWKSVKKPLFVEDLGLTFKALNRLPGIYIKDFLQNIGNVGLVKIIPKGKTRRAFAETVLVYYDGKGKPKMFKGRVVGRIANKPKGVGFGWDPIFIPDGETRTFGEMELSEKNKYSMRAIALKKLQKWLEAQK